MFKKILIPLLIIVSIGCYFFIPKTPKMPIVYISAGGFGQLFDKTGHGFFDLPIVFKDDFDIKQVKSLNKLKEFKYLIMFDVFLHRFEKIKNYPKEKLILFLWEPPSVIAHNYDPKYHEHFAKIFTWNDELVDNKRYFKLYYPELKPMIEATVPFNDKKLLCLLSANKKSSHKDELYTKREEAINYFEEKAFDEFDLYGKFWDKKTHKSYKGAPGPYECLKNYKFCICYENIQNLKGYITEKIFHAFQMGSVPIYLGASNVTDYIPKNCFIDRRDFASNEELYYFLKSITEKEYEEYIANIKSFLTSEKAKPFSPENFVKTIKQALDMEPL
ncbi:MAG: hypothetical protein HZB76_05895 [Chlamydiae bacterium]|nr:hypothetical protein [Chlamydiota bacterium]